MSDKIIAYKGMDENMCCRGKQYEIGKTYTEDKAVCCAAGMHACENPFDVLQYYPMKDKHRFFEVECGGEISKSDEGSKLACTELTVKGELNFAGMLKATLGAVFNRVKAKEPFSSGNSSTAGSSGYSSTAGSSGNSSTAGSSGNSSTAGSSGYSSTAGSSGYSSTAGSSGDSSTAGSSGRYSTAGSSGDYSTAGSSGDSSTAGSSGYSSTAGSSGRSSTAGSSGDYSTAGSSGDSSSATATGCYCRAQAEGKNSLAMANGAHSKARGVLGCYLVLTEYDDDGNMLWAKIAKVDGAAIKENVWYTLKNGEFEEA